MSLRFSVGYGQNAQRGAEPLSAGRKGDLRAGVGREALSQPKILHNEGIDGAAAEGEIQ